jgi:uncharacterized protein (DUF2126 family)
MALMTPGGVLMRCLGRQYPDEPAPRWSYGLLSDRSGLRLWAGPPDPLLCAGELAPPDAARFVQGLVQAAGAAGLCAELISAPKAEADPGRQAWRIVIRETEDELNAALADALYRPSCHGQPIPPEGLVDELAQAGHFLFLLSVQEGAAGPALRLELPALGERARLLRMLALIGDAANDAALQALVLAGYPPPVDQGFEWSTFTPDPAVLEINMAPYPAVAELLQHAGGLFEGAEGLALAPYRLWYNGDVGDSGGGGHITLGGPTPQDSPFVREPRLLARLVRYANHHPSLSYLFAHEYTGAFGQSVRADERDREHVEELSLALTLIARSAEPSVDFVWRSLAPFLADLSGNSHRAEINVEKLWNLHAPERGCLGLVEFRALRMAATPHRQAALAALLRAIVARLALRPFEADLVDWGGELHDRYALPFFLRRDLQAVLEDLDAAGLGLGEPIRRELFDDEARVIGRVALPGAELVVRRAVEFWPLVGDATQAHGTSRLVDSSLSRIELCLRSTAGDGTRLNDWRVAVQGHGVALREPAATEGAVRLIGLRYRRFKPWLGLHPGLAEQGAIEVLLWRGQDSGAHRVTLHEWRPDSAPYEGWPTDLADARARRAERVRHAPAELPQGVQEAPARALSAWCLDLRKL